MTNEQWILAGTVAVITLVILIKVNQIGDMLGVGSNTGKPVKKLFV